MYISQNDPEYPLHHGSDTVYVVNAEKLLPGDIFLSTQQNLLVSKGIRFITDSDFSHAAILMIHSSCIEAVGEGVRIICLDRICISDIKNVRVLRLRDPNKSEVAKKAAEKAREHLFREYWWEGAIATIVSQGTLGNNEGRFFCSHLVAHCYREAGVDLFPENPPEKVVPGDFIGLSKTLVDVTESVFDQKNRSDTIWPTLDIDGYPDIGENYYANLNQIISSELTKKLSTAEWFKPFSNNLHQITDWLGVFFIVSLAFEYKQQYDEILYISLKKHRFDEFFSYVRDHNPWSYINQKDTEQLILYLTIDERNAMNNSLITAERAIKESLEVYLYDLQRVQGKWSDYPQVEQFKSARVLLDFFKQRVFETEFHIKVIESQVAFINQLNTANDTYISCSSSDLI